MSTLKTKPTGEEVTKFLNSIEPEERRKDCTEILALIKKASGMEPEVWGNGTIGFGRFTYKQKGGKAGEWYRIGFSSRKRNISIHTIAGYTAFPELMEKLGKYKTGGGCLYINKLADVDKKTLEKLVKESLVVMKERYPD